MLNLGNYLLNVGRHDATWHTRRTNLAGHEDREWRPARSLITNHGTCLLHENHCRPIKCPWSLAMTNPRVPTRETIEHDGLPAHRAQTSMQAKEHTWNLSPMGDARCPRHMLNYRRGSNVGGTKTNNRATFECPIVASPRRPEASNDRPRKGARIYLRPTINEHMAIARTSP